MSKCNCSMSISVLGDGCRYCQPQTYIDKLSEIIEDERSEHEAELAELQVLLRKIWPLINGAVDAVHDEIKAALAKKELSDV